jgi:hypothetical protein
MYKWYKDSSICLVYLNDVAFGVAGATDTQATFEAASNVFTNCRWITRGWTLQELVAPTALRFYYQDWTPMGDKREFLEELSDATGIPVFVLDNGELSELSLAERMSWASYRHTTRIEDMAYCLLGIFDIQMPLLYGEGEKAFIRLQEEILKSTDDYSLFAWRAVNSDSGSVSKSTYRGLLARSPLEFRDCRSVERENATCNFPMSATAIGLHLELEFLNDPKDRTRFLVLIHCNNSLNQRLAIYLKCLDGGHQYARVEAGSLIPIDNWPTGQARSIYVRQKLSIPRDFYAVEMRCIRSTNGQDIIRLSALGVEPADSRTCYPVSHVRVFRRTFLARTVIALRSIYSFPGHRRIQSEEQTLLVQDCARKKSTTKNSNVADGIASS